MNIITDPLTGLYNARFLKKRFNEELSRSIRHNLQLTLIIVRLDNTGRTQDIKGRADLTHVVKEMARILTASLRDIDLVGRSGEVEFSLILPATPKKEGAFVAERITRTIIAELERGNDSINRQSMQLSAGIAFFPEDGASSAELTKAARSNISPAYAEKRDASVSSVPDLQAKNCARVNARA
jgi:diguanylate cyclase (GGDEF)-like protein